MAQMVSLYFNFSLWILILLSQEEGQGAYTQDKTTYAGT